MLCETADAGVHPTGGPTGRCGRPFRSAADVPQATAAVMTISIFHSGLASAACTVARGGV